MFKRSTPILASLNRDETIAFYTEKLGFQFRDENNGYLIFGRNDIHVHLFSCTNPDDCRNMGCYLYVTDIDTLYEQYQKLYIVHPNGYLRLMPWGIRQFAVVDNNGNIIYIAEDIQRP